MNTKMKNEGEEAETNDRAAVPAEVEKLLQNATLRSSRAPSRKTSFARGSRCTIPVGTKLRIGTALCEVAQIGKECHADCAIRRQAGDCVMPREGIFVIVLEEGDARPGDPVQVIE